MCLFAPAVLRRQPLRRRGYLGALGAAWDDGLPLTHLDGIARAPTFVADFLGCVVSRVLLLHEGP